MGAHVDERVAGQDSLIHRSLDARVDRRDVLPRHTATFDLIHELVSASGAGWLQADNDVGILTLAA